MVPTKKVLLCFALAMLAHSAWAANFSGKWIVPQLDRGPQRVPTILMLYQSGNDVTGTLAPARIDAGTGSPINNEIFGAKVEGDTISFYVWRGTDHPVKLFYKGVLSGDEIAFEVTGGPTSPGSGAGSSQPALEQVKATRTH